MKITIIEEKVLKHLLLRHDEDGQKTVRVCDVIGGSYHTHGLFLPVDDWPKLFRVLSGKKRLVHISGKELSWGPDMRLIRIRAAGRAALQ